TGLNKVTTSNCVEFFLERGILREIGTSETSRGRPPILLDTDPRAGVCIGIEVDYDEIKVLTTDLSGAELDRYSTKLGDDDPHAFVRAAGALIAKAKERYRAYIHGVIGVGVALPGYFGAQSGNVEYVA